MPQFRATVRYGGRYEVLDIEADTLAEALREAADRFPPEAAESGDLVEVRRQVDPEAREYAPG